MSGVELSDKIINILNDSKKSHPELSYSDIIFAYYCSSSDEAKYRKMDYIQQCNETKDTGIENVRR